MSESAIEDVVDASNALYAAGLSDMVWGHASVRDADGRGVWMKAAGWGFEEIDPNRVVLVTPEGEVLSGEGPRHIEYPIHTEITAARPDVGAVVHTHAPALSAFASLDAPLLPISHDAVPFASPQIPRFSGPGSLIATRELGAALARDLGQARGILLPKHGAVTVGSDIGAAVMNAVLLERACRTALSAIAAGGPQVWSDDEETAFKRNQIRNDAGLNAGWRYLVRKAGRENPRD
ncbi:class II aldolase/adducin family protein [Arthrobacter sp. SD76]|uniref:class II aldolase/adducin family protein n=1 Tax=Arthrobacter sp. SD76 TaxID=3415007 RepID=UPI003C720C30